MSMEPTPNLQNFRFNGGFTLSTVTALVPPNTYQVVGTFNGSSTINAMGSAFSVFNVQVGDWYVDPTGKRYQITAINNVPLPFNPLDINVIALDANGAPAGGAGVMYRASPNFGWTLPDTISILDASESIQQACRTRCILEIDEQLANPLDMANVGGGAGVFDSFMFVTATQRPTYNLRSFTSPSNELSFTVVGQTVQGAIPNFTGGAILTRNAGDTANVSLVGGATGDTLTWNGSTWVAAPGIYNVANVGGFAGVFRDITSNTINLRTMQSSASTLTVVQNANDINFNIANFTAGAILSRNAANTANVSLTGTLANDILLWNGTEWVSSSGIAGANVGGFTEIFRDVTTGNTLNFRTLHSTGSTITFTQNADDVNMEVTNPVPAPGAAGNTLFSNGTSWTILPPGTAGQVLTLNTTATATQWNTVNLSTVGNAAGGETATAKQVSAAPSPQPYNLNVKTINAGAGITLTSTATDLTITANGTVPAVQQYTAGIVAGGGGGATVAGTCNVTTFNDPGLGVTYVAAAPGSATLTIPAGVTLLSFRIQGVAANLAVGALALSTVRGAVGFDTSIADARFPVMMTYDGLLSASATSTNFAGNSWIATAVAGGTINYTFVPNPFIGSWILVANY